MLCIVFFCFKVLHTTRTNIIQFIQTNIKCNTFIPQNLAFGTLNYYKVYWCSVASQGQNEFFREQRAPNTDHSVGVTRTDLLAIRIVVYRKAFACIGVYHKPTNIQSLQNYRFGYLYHRQKH